MNARPLEGIRILDLTQFMSGPMCTLLLSDFGAEVIKIESPPIKDDTHDGEIAKTRNSILYAVRNRGKKSVILDLKNETQKKMFLELLTTADAVVENFAPGTMEDFGITYDLLKEVNPRIVYTSISGYGQKGPYSKHSVLDAVLQAESGLMSITGEADSQNIKCGAAIADYIGSLTGCIGTLIGIVDAQRTGRGRRIDASMMDALLLLQEDALSTYLENGILPRSNRSRYSSASLIKDYACRDGVRIMLSISDNMHWKALAESLHQPQWLANPVFATPALRRANTKKVEAEISRVFAEYDSDDIMALLRAADCAYGKINNYADIVNHPQIEYRKTFVNAVYPNGTTFRVPGNPLRMSGMRHKSSYAAVPVGYNTIEVFSEVVDENIVHTVMDPILKQVEENI